MRSLDTIILAAGNASRFGSPKQLAAYKGHSFIDLAIVKAQELPTRNIYVVLGAYHKEIKTKIQSYGVNIVMNSDWKKGMGTSISSAMNAISLKGEIPDAVLIILVDQPQLMINHQHLDTLIQKWLENPTFSVATKYSDQLGAPCILTAQWFDNLSNLPPKQGAKKILNSEINPIIGIRSSEATDDIDTPEDYKRLLNNQ